MLSQTHCICSNSSGDPADLNAQASLGSVLCRTAEEDGAQALEGDALAHGVEGVQRQPHHDGRRQAQRLQNNRWLVQRARSPQPHRHACRLHT